MSDINEGVRSKTYRGDLEFSIEERTPERVVSRMPIRPGMLNPFGTVHAGAMLWFADVTATVLALGDTTLGPQGQGFPLAIDLHSTLLGNRRAGELKAEAKFVRRGKRVMVVRTQVSDGDNVLVEVTTTHIPA
jgi:1,4-dihydroxy-2-naphthoyl-CoA hydrolase